MPLDGAPARAARRRRASACCSPSTAPTRAGSGRSRRRSSRRRSSLNVDHHHDNTRFGNVNVVVADASSTGEIVRDLMDELGVRADARDRRGALHRARHRHRSLPVREHDAEGAAARRRARRGRRRRPPRLPGRSTRSVQFAKLKLLARALERAQVYEGGGIVVSYLLKTDFAEVGAAEPYSEGIIDFLRAVEGADMAALIREPPRTGTSRAADQPALELRRARRLGDRARLGRRRRPPPGGRVLARRRRSPRSSSSSASEYAEARAARGA